jgi:hypothetical protein
MPPSAAAASTDEPASSSAGQSPGGSAPGTFPSGIRLSEVLAVPKDTFDTEWIEIANDSDTPADLAGWRLDDGAGGGAPYSLPVGSVVGPQGFLVAMMPHALFNNTGDVVRLIRPDGVSADEFSYSAAVADLSFCLLKNAWMAECPPTPGAANRHTTNSTEPGASDSQTPAPADVSAASEESIDLLELGADPVLATPLPRPPVVLRGAGSGGFVYALAMPGSVYRGITMRTPTPWAAPSPEPAPRLSTMAIRTTAPAPTNVPIGPIAGGVLIALGIIIAGYALIRHRSATIELSEPGAAPPEQAVDTD